MDVIEHLNGDIGTNHAVIRDRVVASIGDPYKDNDWTAMKQVVVHEEYLAMHMFLHADVKRYGALIATLRMTL